ncbi:MAG: acyltransferase family protein, partial [Mycobacterium sp.]
LPTRAWELAVGGLVALTVAQWRRLPTSTAAILGCAGLAIILFASSELGTSTPYPGTAALLPVLGTALVIGAGCAAPSGGAGRALSLPPMRAVGRVSYSWYLWHWPVLLFAAPLVGHSLGLVGRLTAVAVSGGLAVLTLRFIENPCRSAISLRRSDGRSLALGGAATAVAACTGAALFLAVPIPSGHGPSAPRLTVTELPTSINHDVSNAVVQQAYSQVQAAVAVSAALRGVPSNLDPPLANASGDRAAILVNGCLLSFDQVRQGECATGDTASATTVALVGDSHATMWNPALQQVANRRQWRLETMGKEACPLMNLPINYPRLRREYTECEQWRSQILARLEVEHPQLVVLSMSRSYGTAYGFRSYDPAWIESLKLLVTKLRAVGSKVLVLGPIPSPPPMVPTCLSAHLDDATACSPERSTAVSDSGIAAEHTATESSGGDYADLTELFCTTDRCPAIVGNTLVYRDDNHLTSQYALELAPVIAALEGRALASH